jgi:hypothetical protein
MMEYCFSLRANCVSHYIDGMSMLIDFDTGLYYELNNSATDILNWIKEECVNEQMLNELKSKNQNEAILVIEFLDNLRKANLIIENEHKPRVISHYSLDLASLDTAPQLIAYYDMKHILKFKSVFNTDACGWPVNNG